MVDKLLILRKLTDIDEYYDQLKEYVGITTVDYLKDWKTQRIVERTLQMMIETCLDIANHIISDKGFRAPDNYADTFVILNENNILNEALKATMVKMAKFRNVVVHHYDRIDAAIVITILNKRIGDFMNYKEAILKVLDKCR